MTGKDGRLRHRTVQARREGLRTNLTDELANLRRFKNEARLRHQIVRAHREALHAKLLDELANLRGFKAADSVSDGGDVAIESESDEMLSQLTELYIHEMSQIEEALARLGQGTYGLCEGGSEYCQKRIPKDRLNALPYTRFCLYCEREIDNYSSRGRRKTPNTACSVNKNATTTKKIAGNTNTRRKDSAGGPDTPPGL
jgi:RNA polymerase-binding transcription factor DksA